VSNSFVLRLQQAGKMHYFNADPSIEMEIEKFSFALELDMKMYDEFCEGASPADAAECLRLGKAHCGNLIVALMKKINRDHCT